MVGRVQLPSQPSPNVVFPSSRVDDAPLEDLRGAWGAALKAADLEGVEVHDLRRTTGSTGAAIGMPLQVIARVMGHTRTEVTERHYAHLAEDPLREAAGKIQNRIADAMAGEQGPRATVTRIDV